VTGELFVDTGWFFALQVPDDRWHRVARESLERTLHTGAHLVTTNHVVGETYSLLLKTHGHAAAWRFVDALERSPRLEQVHVDEKTEREAYGILRRYRDQAFSFVDGTSFAIMRQRKARLALAFDRHFAAAGFSRVPLDAPVP
jgi:predicted nucleic acid-binding protein